ncbi:hypothetical protein SBY92_002629 [Candida maltosa Xu316]|uniref:Derlin n=1 Tax=Candida maltosa (strain Xu316) TaxID=1245528 RepID=M3J3G6_CANMX|nr:hypothetical protein G210_3312 [Candida maltosa Xu316]
MDLLWTHVPPITKTWIVLTTTTSILISLHKLNPQSLTFHPNLAFTTEPWRLITPFIAIDELSSRLFFKILEISISCGGLESALSTKPDTLPERIIDEFDRDQLETLHRFTIRNQSLDYLYLLSQIIISVIMSVTVLYYEYGVLVYPLGKLLSRVLLYMHAQISPHDRINVMGVVVRRRYYPWLLMGAWMFFSEPVHHNFSNLVNVEYGVLLRNEYVWFEVLVIGLGHFWWVVRVLLLEKVHYDGNERRRLLKRKVLEKYGVVKVDVVRELLILILLPPWYWVILSKIRNRRG